MRAQFNLHWFTWVPLLIVLSAFLWLNLDLSNDAYMDRDAHGWRGGGRLGFPLPWWDAGRYVQVTVKDGQCLMTWTPYGGWQFRGLLVDAALFLVALGVVGGVSEWLLRRRLGAAESPAAVDAASVRAVSMIVACVVAAALLRLNFFVHTSVGAELGGTARISQAMGWPLVTYRASDPALDDWLLAQSPPPAPADCLRYLQAHPDLPWRLSHWFTRNIVLNICIGLAAVVSTAWVCEFVLRRWRAHRASAQPAN